MVKSGPPGPEIHRTFGERVSTAGEMLVAVIAAAGLTAIGVGVGAVGIETAAESFGWINSPEGLDDYAIRVVDGSESFDWSELKNHIGIVNVVGGVVGAYGGLMLFACIRDRDFGFGRIGR